MSQKRLSMIKCAAIVALALTAFASGLYFAHNSGANPEAYGNDFNVYYHAAREVIAGRDPYQHSLGDWTPYIYPPLLAEAIAPLALLPLPAAAYVWFLLSAASIAAAAWMSASLASGKQERGSSEEQAGNSELWRRAIAACAVVFVLRFVLDTFNLGQVNGVVVALSAAHIYLYARDRKALSALALVVAVSIKLTPALLLLYHIGKLRLKFVITCATLLVALTALSFLPFGRAGSDVFQTFWSRTVRNEQGYDFRYSGNQSLRGAIARLIDRSPEDAVDGRQSRKPTERVTLLAAMALLALALFAAFRTRSEMAGIAPFFCCMVLLSPLSWKAHYVILVLPFAHLVSVAKEAAKRRLMIGVTIGAAFALFNLTSPRVIGLTAAEWADEHSLVFSGGLLIFFACAASCWLPDDV